jgi:hypothetical protein
MNLYLSMVDMADGADVHVRQSAFKLSGHAYQLLSQGGTLGYTLQGLE